ncbi:hypothetical protein [Thermosediminibacter litoriperuensis]|uniref:SurA-like protein n=1 Tax=Thermosediminibacter litoriperuensis TaxID=291989 RepID=A0A5S5AWV5_9FIRM|nr:hypothetical protein [Thermosediminibacter litoriperuensis]TYP57673.1 hypothetical protein LZ11_00667 [Thermosediminibacter litoriperuensis]
MKKKLLILSVALLLTVLMWSITYRTTNFNKENEDELAELLKRVGNYEKENKELRMQKGEEIIALVNGIPIYKNEVEYRKGLVEIAYGKRDDEFINSFAAIVRVKILSDFAEKNNIHVNDEEIFDYIKKEKANEDLVKYVKIFCENAGMTLEEYWNEYEYEKVKLLLTLKKLEDSIIEQGIQKGEIPQISDYHIKQKYVKDFQNNLIEKADIEIDQNYIEELKGFNNEKLFK